MIREIIIKNFESHVHTVLNGFSPGFNLIFGDSNSGKTAIIRAVRLVAQNQFNPKSVRIGNDDCEVVMTSDRGIVRVVRGKQNFWEVTADGKTEVFERIGKAPLSQAVEILGLGEVKLGDAMVSANIMDQLEGHFMLAELDGKSVSGSMRAQVIDEISGLSGIETIIREASLDNHRLGRKVSDLEKAAVGFRGQMHDAGEIKVEFDFLDEIEKTLAEYDEVVGTAIRAEGEMENHHRVVGEISSSEREIELLPDVGEIPIILEQAKEYFEDSDLAFEIHKSWSVVDDRITTLQGEINGLSDIGGISKDVERVGLIFDSVKAQESVFEIWDRERDEIQSIESEIGMLPDVEMSDIEKVKEIFDRMGRYDALLLELGGVVESIEATEVAFDACGVELTAASRELNDAIESVEICPLTQKPVVGRCFN